MTDERIEMRLSNLERTISELYVVVHKLNDRLIMIEDANSSLNHRVSHMDTGFGMTPDWRGDKK